MLEEFIPVQRVAYFTMEIAMRADIPTYSGGLGILAGDTMRSAVDLDLPFVAVSLISRRGYFHQVIDSNGRQQVQPDSWQPLSCCHSVLEAKITVPIESRNVWVGGCLFVMEGQLGGRQPVVLLDTDLNENIPADREITHYLYGGDTEYRFKQEIVLGIGGVRMLHALGFRVLQYHMNEGHSALLTLELLRRHAYSPEDVRTGEAHFDYPLVRDMCNFTTHTPVEAGHDKYPYALVERMLGDYLDMVVLKHLAGETELNMTQLALNMSDYVNGVAKRHAEISQNMFPGYHVRAITNGVHPQTWTAPSFINIYDQHLPGWCHEPELLTRVDQISDDVIWQAHREAKDELLELIKVRTGEIFHPKIPLIGFARRMTAYKRPDLLFSDLARLKAIAQQWPFQLVFAGKAHPNDQEGFRLIESIIRTAKSDSGIPIVFIPNYDMDVARRCVSGVDVWLNTPLRPLEASGTSGMKAAFNGVPSLSILDGWWIEGCIEGVTGWAIGDSDHADNNNDATALYDKLEQVVLPLYYYAERAKWVAVMKGAISKNASYFNSHRMMRRYVTEAYLH